MMRRADALHLRYHQVGAEATPAGSASAPSFYIGNITSVYKRFYDGFCEMQVLFSESLGLDLKTTLGSGDSDLSGVDESWFPWEQLLDVANFCLKRRWNRSRNCVRYSSLIALGQNFHLLVGVMQSF